MNIQIFIFLRLNYSTKQWIGNELIVPAFVDVEDAGWSFARHPFCDKS